MNTSRFGTLPITLARVETLRNAGRENASEAMLNKALIEEFQEEVNEQKKQQLAEEQRQRKNFAVKLANSQRMRELSELQKIDEEFKRQLEIQKKNKEEEQLKIVSPTEALVEIIFVVGHYTMLSMVANSTGVAGEPGWARLGEGA